MLSIEELIAARIQPIAAEYNYADEKAMNPAYENLDEVVCPLRLNDIRIWVLRSDFILATGIKNAYQKEYHYQGFEQAFEPDMQPFINPKDRYGHPSLAIPEKHYDGKVFYAGYLYQHETHLQVYIASGRYERNDLNLENRTILEAYIAQKFLKAYGVTSVIFETGSTSTPSYHACFFSGEPLPETPYHPSRTYDESAIREILTPLLSLPSLYC